MPKIKKDTIVRRLITEYGDLEEADGDVKCKFCGIQVPHLKKSSVLQHLKTKKHGENKDRFERRAIPGTSNDSNEDEVQHQPPASNKDKAFNKELCEVMIAADIPLNKLESKPFSSFLEKISGQKLLDQSTLRKYYVADIYRETIDFLRKKVDGKKLWISVDETSDCEQRHVSCFVFGILGDEEERNKCYLGNMAQLESVNHSTIAAFVNDFLSLLWPTQIMYQNVLIMVTDAVAYMSKAMRGLQVLYPKMVHVTCLAHGLHRVAEVVRYNYPEVNQLVSSTKSVFLKAPLRVKKFREISPGIPLPPSPVVTRWGTWLDAVKYYSTHLEKVIEVLEALDETEAQSIVECKKVVDSVELKVSLSFIAANFDIISKNIVKLEARGLSLQSAISKIEEVRNRLEGLYDRTYIDKLNYVLKKNKGFSTLCEISSLLTGRKKKTENEFIKQFSSDELLLFLNAPVVSCDPERVFSVYKTVLADNRRSFIFDNLKQHMIIKCNERC